jgi:hypothetical protein
MPLAATTAYQALKKYEGDLAGKTVFVPAGCMSTTPFTRINAVPLMVGHDSGRDRPLRLPTSQARLPRGEGDHDCFDVEGIESPSTSG